MCALESVGLACDGCIEYLQLQKPLTKNLRNEDGFLWIPANPYEPHPRNDHSWSHTG